MIGLIAALEIRVEAAATSCLPGRWRLEETGLGTAMRIAVSADNSDHLRSGKVIDDERHSIVISRRLNTTRSMPRWPDKQPLTAAPRRRRLQRACRPFGHAARRHHLHKELGDLEGAFSPIASR
jgi:hypothetical protein